MGPVRSLFYFIVMRVHTFVETYNKVLQMLLKIFIVIIYLLVFSRFFAKWRKSGFILQGNEILVLQAFVPFAFILPGGEEQLVPRLSVHLAIFAICFFWYLLFPKVAEAVIKWAAVALISLMALEGIAKLLPSEYGSLLFPISVLVVLSFFYGTCFLKCEDDKLLKSVFNLGKFRGAVSVGFIPLLAAGCILLIYPICSKNSYVGWILITIMALFPLGYICRYKPACWNYDQMLELKKKAYLLGKAINKEEQCLEDDGGIINESVVEDARILYNVMKLFEEEKLYRNYEIKIGEVARRIGTNKTYLSRALNTRVSKNFCQFVNHYRIREICMLYLKDPKKEIRNLSEPCGFSSQSNFSIVFKYNTGYTPGDWCRIVKAKLERNEAVDIDDYLL